MPDSGSLGGFRSKQQLFRQRTAILAVKIANIANIANFCHTPPLATLGSGG
jgi:hypothetical protein